MSDQQNDEAPDDLLYEAWVVIANAGGWVEGVGSSEGWREAAEAWRDKYHAHIGAQQRKPKRVGRDCQEDNCDRTVDDGPLWRVNPKGERGVFMCGEHARELREVSR